MNRMGNKRRNQDFGDEGNDNGFGDFEGGPPNKRGKGGMGGGRDSEHLRKIFIGGLSSNTTEESLKSHFEEWGEIVDCVVMRDPNSKRSRGFGFITYKHPEDVDKAQENRPHTLDGKEVETKRATPREESNKPEARMSIKKVFVGGIKEDIEQEHLQDYFSKFGNIISVDVIVDKNTNKKRGFAFCTFDDYDPVDKIVLEKSHYINGRRCDVKKALSKDEMEKAKAKEMSMANRQGGYGGGMGGGGGFGGNDGGMGGRGNRDRGGYMGGDSDFRGGRGGNFGGNQGNYNQGGGGNYGNQGGNFGNQGMQGGSGYNQQQSNWGNQGGSGNWGNQNQGGSGYNQGGYNNQGMGNQGGSGGNWGNNQGNWGNQGGSGMNQGGNQGFGGGGGSYNSSGNYGSSSGSYNYNTNQGGGGGWGNQSGGSSNYGSGSGSGNYGNYSSGGQSGDFGGNQRNQGGSFGGRR